MNITAKIITDSISAEGNRLTTFLLAYPKFIHGEFMTHRVFSRNASSSCAIPVSRNIEIVRSDAERATPVYWGAEQKGMASGEELSEVINPSDNCSPKDVARYWWEQGAEYACDVATALIETGVHKSIVNRVLEPYLPIHVVCTATEYMNFFGLRLAKDAQPEIRVLAEAMWRVYGESDPNLMGPGEWHLPFVEQSDFDTRIAHIELGEQVRRMSVARCACVSYMSHDTGKRSTVEEDLKLYDSLATSGHWSPFEHQATPDDFDIQSISVPETITEDQKRDRVMPMTLNGFWRNPEQHANFRGWRQYRKMIAGEAVKPLPQEYR